MNEKEGIEKESRKKMRVGQQKNHRKNLEQQIECQ